MDTGKPTYEIPSAMRATLNGLWEEAKRRRQNRGAELTPLHPFSIESPRQAYCMSDPLYAKLDELVEQLRLAMLTAQQVESVVKR